MEALVYADSKPFVLLIIGGKIKNNWYDVFQSCEVMGRHIQVEMARWEDLEVTNFSDSGVIVSLRASRDSIPDTSMSSHRTIRPDHVLIRSAPFGAYGQGANSCYFENR